MAAIVIADASPLIGLARVNGIHWLQQLFGQVVVPCIVAEEVLTGHFPDSERPIRSAIAAGWLVVEQTIPETPSLPDLDEGEAACIRVALASSSPALLLVDERAGRAIAQNLGLMVAGTAAVIGMAHRQGLIGSAREVFAELHSSDFRIAPDVIQAVLRRCENPS